ncbi:ATP-binding protein [Nitrosopumilus sp. b3]|uniref:ATP-binding protein n=1 Tax=Nitrosopumilus sp. b3 TaxID=2109909 RepID=UPI0015F724A0|nr:ATP-binding protein [Nitrosopumilus sp. b3]
MGIISIFQLQETSEHLNLLDDNLDTLKTSERLLLHANKIQYYDEVLTQSARNYAFTGDEIWEKRYFEIEPLLSEELSGALDLGNNIEKSFFSSVNDANSNLVNLELEVIESVKNGNLKNAISILESQEYKSNKEIYQKSLMKYLENRNLEHTSIMEDSTTDVDISLEIIFEDILFGISFLVISITITVVGFLVLGYFLSQSILKPILKLENASKQIIDGNLDVKTGIYSKDEIGELSRSFEFMLNHLKKTTDIETQLSLQHNLRKALDESSIVSIIDKNGKIKYANDKFCQVSKYSKDELIGQRQDILRSSKIHPPSFYADLWSVISKGNIWHGEICNTAKDGTLFWNDTTVIPFLDKEGKISEYVSVRKDITEQKNLTKKLLHAERLSAIGELSSRMSHDIRNPLSIIQNEFELLKRKKILDEKQIERVTTSINRITHQLNDVLDFLRDTPVISKKFNLSNLLSKVLSSLNAPSGVKIKTSGDEIFMFGDESKMNVVLVNLIYNAIQAVEESGEIDVFISKTNTEIIIKVTDSGPGITIKPLEKVFDPLITSKQKGTGLGLASVKNIITQHNGTISVKNNPTTFIIKIPQKEENDNSSNS